MWPRCHVILARLQMSISYILDRVLLLGQIWRFKNSAFQKDRDTAPTRLWNNLINFENPMSKELNILKYSKRFSILPSQKICCLEKENISCENFSIFTNIVIDVEAAKLLTNKSEKYFAESFTMNKNFWL